MPNVCCSAVCLNRLFSTFIGCASRFSSIDHAHAGAVRLVAQVGDAVDLAVLDHLGDALEQGGLVDLVRQLGDDDLEAIAARSIPRRRPSPGSRRGHGRSSRRRGCLRDRGSCRRSGNPAPARSPSAPRRCTPGCRSDSAMASQISLRLCGGMFVAMPTAMPTAPLISRFGSVPGGPSAPWCWRRSWA